jgi:hypothetical protein
MKTFVMMALNTIVSALIGMLFAMVAVGFAENEGEAVLDKVAVTTKKKAYDRGRRDGVQQAKEEIMANLRAD